MRAILQPLVLSSPISVNTEFARGSSCEIEHAIEVAAALTIHPAIFTTSSSILSAVA